MTYHFGYAELKQEGKKLWPASYLHINGQPPPKSFYTKEELEKQKQEGYTDIDYAD